MPTVDTAKLLGDLKDGVLGVIKDQAKDFLDQNQDAKDFIEERLKRIEELGLDYAKALAAGQDTAAIATQLQVVQQSIRNELAGVAVQASAKARATFASIVDTALGILIKAIPVVLAAL